MKNREYLNGLTSNEIALWLEAEKEEPKAIEISSETDWGLFPNFKPIEFTCPCGKCEYSTPEGVANLDYKLLFALQTLRNKYKKPISITCGARCEEYNNSLQGSVQGSYHCKLKAADFYIAGVTSTEAGREEVIAFLKLLPAYKYSYHNKGGKYPNMGAAVHLEVK